MKYEFFKPKNADILEIKGQIKKCSVQKSLRMCFYLFLGGQKKLDFFSKFWFFGTPFKKKFFFHFTAQNLSTFLVTSSFDPKNALLRHLTGGGVQCTPPHPKYVKLDPIQGRVNLKIINNNNFYPFVKKLCLNWSK